MVWQTIKLKHRTNWSGNETNANKTALTELTLNYFRFVDQHIAVQMVLLIEPASRISNG